jgi:hypothetical protein
MLRMKGDFTWLGEEPVIKESDIAETVDTEVLIIGGGQVALRPRPRRRSWDWGRF